MSLKIVKMSLNPQVCLKNLGQRNGVKPDAVVDHLLQTQCHCNYFQNTNFHISKEVWWILGLG